MLAQLLAYLRSLFRRKAKPNPPTNVRVTITRRKRPLVFVFNWRKSMTLATITWTDPTTRTDGSAIAPDSLTINIFDTSAAPIPGNPPLGSVKGGVQTFTTPVLNPGVHAFALDAVDSEGDTSVMTTPVSVTVGFSNPNPPSNIAVTMA